MIQAGYPPKGIQEILGHASITTTLDSTATCSRATSTAGRTCSTPLPSRLVRPKCGQKTMRTPTMVPPESS
jgi:hypothetical protein